MKRVAISQLKDRLSEYLRLVKRGQTLEIVERSIPIARIEAIRPVEHSGREKFERLVQEGVISRPNKRLDKAFLAHPPIACSGDVVKAVIEERGDR